MKKIATIAAIAALTTLAACGDASAPTEATTEATTVEATNEAVEAPEAEKTGGPCGDGTVLRENEQCK